MNRSPKSSSKANQGYSSRNRQPLLELTGVGKEFGAIRALHGIDLQVFPGKVVGLMGDNGAGKSTLVKIIAGNFPPSHGEIRFDGNVVQFARPIEARAVGIEGLPGPCARRQPQRSRQCLPRPRAQTQVWSVRLSRSQGDGGAGAGELRSETRPYDLVKQMSGGQRQAVAIARTRLSNAKLVMMDEPTAAISVRQVEQVLSLIHRLKEQGVAVMLIPHARRLRGLRSRRRHAPRREARRQGHWRHQSRGSHLPVARNLSATIARRNR